MINSWFFFSDDTLVTTYEATLAKSLSDSHLPHIAMAIALRAVAEQAVDAYLAGRSVKVEEAIAQIETRLELIQQATSNPSTIAAAGGSIVDSFAIVARAIANRTESLREVGLSPSLMYDPTKEYKGDAGT